MAVLISKKEVHLSGISDNFILREACICESTDIFVSCVSLCFFFRSSIFY